MVQEVLRQAPNLALLHGCASFVARSSQAASFIRVYLYYCDASAPPQTTQPNQVSRELTPKPTLFALFCTHFTHILAMSLLQSLRRVGSRGLAASCARPFMPVPNAPARFSTPLMARAYATPVTNPGKSVNYASTPLNTLSAA